MSKEITIVSNAVDAKLINPDRDAKILATEVLSYYVQGYENIPSVKEGRWDGKSSMYDWETDRFPSGFIPLMNAALTEVGYTVTNASKPLPKPLGTLPETLGGFSYTEKYDYQWDAISALEKRGKMVARLATGAGKTFMAALAIARINRPTLIITKRSALLHQFKERLEDFGYEVGIIGDGENDLKTMVNVGMSQTLAARIREGDERILEYLDTVEFIIGEEAHEISDNSYWETVRRCKNAYYGLGLTATAYISGKGEANMKLLGAFGGKGIEVPEWLLIERGINATPYIRYADYGRPTSLRYGSNYQKAVSYGLVDCEPRNRVIVENVVKAAKRKLSSLVLVERKEHGKILFKMLSENGIRVEYIYGEDDSDKRTKALKRLSNGEVDCLIGSKIVDVGVDVPCIFLVVLAGGGKGEITYRQRIGRGLRAKPSGPNVCFILDFKDEWNQHLNSHYIERLKMVKKTKGFVENLRVDGADFPWELFPC